MSRRRISLLVVFLTLALVAPAGAQDTRARLLIDAAQLASLLDDPGLVLLHVGRKPDYDREHIPGAQYIALDMISAPRPATPDAGLILELPPAAELRRTFERFGVTPASRVVVYAAGNQLTQATRVLFALDWLGLGDRSALLDGGLDAWKAADRPVTADVITPRPGRLADNIRVNSDAVVSLDWVRARLNQPGFAIVDARAAVFYEGREPGMASRPGRIPGALHVPFSSVTDSTFRFVDTAALQRLFDAAGVARGDTVVAYCHIGQQASTVYFAARLLGYPVRLYDGSFTEWASRAELPVETGVRR